MIFIPKKASLLMSAVSLCVVVSACTTSSNQTPQQLSQLPLVPAQKFDLSHWKITIPSDLDGDLKADTISVRGLQSYSNANFFYLNDENEMVFTSPNKAITTANSSNTRSELRQMLRGTNTKIDTKSYANNFALEANAKSGLFGAIGGKMEATLKVNHVSVNAGHPDKAPAYSAVVGQIHGVKESSVFSRYGYGNEPLKIYYKKFPNHNTGSVFWTYERNLAKKNPDRRDIVYPVWGNTWNNPADPGSQGIALNEEFSYTVNVYQNIMYLTFETANQETVKYQIDLSNNIDANGNVDTKDNPGGYTGDQLYFKAGIYNQCSTKDIDGFWYTACPGTGDWKTDFADGNYAQSTFSKLKLSASHPPSQ